MFVTYSRCPHNPLTMVKLALKIERKHIFIEKVREGIKIEEKSNGIVARIDLPADVLVWLVEKFMSLLLLQCENYTSGSKSFMEIDLVVIVKSNSAGWFISTLCYQKRGAKRRNIICAPFRRNGKGQGRP